MNAYGHDCSRRPQSIDPSLQGRRMRVAGVKKAQRLLRCSDASRLHVSKTELHGPASGQWKSSQSDATFQKSPVLVHGSQPKPQDINDGLLVIFANHSSGNFASPSSKRRSQFAEWSLQMPSISRTSLLPYYSPRLDAQGRYAGSHRKPRP